MSKDPLVVRGLVKHQHVSDLIIVDSSDVEFLTGTLRRIRRYPDVQGQNPAASMTETTAPSR